MVPAEFVLAGKLDCKLFKVGTGSHRPLVSLTGKVPDIPQQLSVWAFLSSSLLLAGFLACFSDHLPVLFASQATIIASSVSSIWPSVAIHCSPTTCLYLAVPPSVCPVFCLFLCQLLKYLSYCPSKKQTTKILRNTQEEKQKPNKEYAVQFSFTLSLSWAHRTKENCSSAAAVYVMPSHEGEAPEFWP